MIKKLWYFSFHFYSLLPISSSPISENLSLFFARLCLSLLIALETTSDLSKKYPLASKLVNEILEFSEAILNALLSELSRLLIIEKQSARLNSTNVTAILKSAVWLVSSGLLKGAKGAVNSIQTMLKQVRMDLIN